MRSSYLLLPALLLFLVSCSEKHPDGASLINKEASLPAAFNFSKMGLKVITSSINKKQGTMSTLYGNDLALNTAKAGRPAQPGEVLALITWKQKDDDRWFGAKIPGKLQSMEMINTTAAPGAAATVTYKHYDGDQMALNPDTLVNQERIKYIFDQKPSVMP
ncbi:cytochrome P460 family protein [Pedobacter sp. L105]|uniref:cytochrome P460 family protein n=1 Tax=Pedobacter sp. L105 TaxID=1641871 RepID=UPI00131E8521|nr:cytochrome P460 family protein [Pedobacter sp. L105]